MDNVVNNNDNNSDNNKSYISNIYKSINNYFFKNKNNDSVNLNNKDRASNNLNNQQQVITNNNTTTTLDNDNDQGIINNIKSIIKDDKSVHGNSYNLKPLENYELDEDTIKKQSANDNIGSSTVTSNSVSNIINNVGHSIVGIVSTSNGSEDSGVEGSIKDIIMKKQNEITNKIEQLSEVINDETIDEDTMIKKTIDILGKKRFYELLFLFGSASIISFALRTLYFGKTIRAIEIPDGDLTTIVIRSNSVYKLKRVILQNQPPIYPGVELNIDDIKTSTFIDPHFTEPIFSNRDVRRLDDGSYVLWTKSDFEIPRTAVGLKSLMKDRDLFIKHSTDAEVDKLIRLISLFGPSLILEPPSTLKLLLFKYKLKIPSDTDRIIIDNTTSGSNSSDHQPLSIKERDELISIVISASKDREQIFNLYHKYHNDIIQFKLQLKKWIKSKLANSSTTPIPQSN